MGNVSANMFSSVWRLTKKAKDLFSWFSFVWHVLGWLGLAGILSGLGVTAVAVAGAVVQGLPWPFILMGAYCTLVAMAYLAALPLFIRRTGNQPATVDPSGSPKPETSVNWSIWREMSEYTIHQFAAILAKYDPNKSRLNSEAETYKNLLLDELKHGHLKYKKEYKVAFYSDHQYEVPVSGQTRISRTDALSWAGGKRYDASHVG